jgi:hypothetical protein
VYWKLEKNLILLSAYYDTLPIETTVLVIKSLQTVSNGVILNSLRGSLSRESWYAACSIPESLRDDLQVLAERDRFFRLRTMEFKILTYSDLRRELMIRDLSCSKYLLQKYETRELLADKKSCRSYIDLDQRLLNTHKKGYATILTLEKEIPVFGAASANRILEILNNKALRDYIRIIDKIKDCARRHPWDSDFEKEVNVIYDMEIERELREIQRQQELILYGGSGASAILTLFNPIVGAGTLLASLVLSKLYDHHEKQSRWALKKAELGYALR